MATNTLSEKVLDFFNLVNDPYEITHRIKEDPNFSSGLSKATADQIMATRNNLPNKRFTSIKQIDDVKGVGSSTLHNILYSFHDLPSIGKIRFAHGRTTPGATDWQTYPFGVAPENATSLYVDVDTSENGFKSEPQYFSSIGGTGSHWALTGPSAIYPRLDYQNKINLPMETGFRVYVRFPNGGNVTPDFANKCNWHINWMGIGE